MTALSYLARDGDSRRWRVLPHRPPAGGELLLRAAREVAIRGVTSSATRADSVYLPTFSHVNLLWQQPGSSRAGEINRIGADVCRADPIICSDRYQTIYCRYKFIVGSRIDFGYHATISQMLQKLQCFQTAIFFRDAHNRKIWGWQRNDLLCCFFSGISKTFK